MTRIPVKTGHNRSDDLHPADRQDLVVLLRILEGWLLVAEPETVRELDRYLLSEGIESVTSDLLGGMERILAALE